MTEQRGDARVIRRIAELYGPQPAVAWQRPPQLVLPVGLAAELLEFKDRVLAGEFQDARSPWGDVVVDIDGGYSSMEQPDSEMGHISLRAWMRITLGAEVARGAFQRSSPWISPQLHQHLVDSHTGMVVQAWELWPDPDDRRPLLMGPTVMSWRPQTADHPPGLQGFCSSPVCPRRGDQDYHVLAETVEEIRQAVGTGPSTWWEHSSDPMEELRRMDRRAHGTMMWRGVRSLVMAQMVLAYLTQCEEYVVAVSPTAADGRGERSPKPWTRTDLPRLILIDPGRVAEFGHPRAEARGTHAAPRPHQRRGHWRHFRAERYVNAVGKRTWVRQMWVGEREWVSQGQRYSVVWPSETSG